MKECIQTDKSDLCKFKYVTTRCVKEFHYMPPYCTNIGICFLLSHCFISYTIFIQEIFASEQNYAFILTKSQRTMKSITFIHSIGRNSFLFDFWKAATALSKQVALWLTFSSHFEESVWAIQFTAENKSLVSTWISNKLHCSPIQHSSCKPNISNNEAKDIWNISFGS